MNPGYLAHGGKKLQGNVVMYHHYEKEKTNEF